MQPVSCKWRFRLINLCRQRFRKKGAKLTFDEQLAEEKRRTKFLEQWGSYHIECIQKERRAISNAMASQSRALEALREESEELYQMAIQVRMIILLIIYMYVISTALINTLSASTKATNEYDSVVNF